MSPYKHSEISVKRRGGMIDDYYQLHSFMDSTKELCSDNRHRILHTHWAIRNIIIPIFGEYILNSDGRKLNVKDICEKDHILIDYSNRFIPTLNDFVKEINISDSVVDKFNPIFKLYSANQDLAKLLLSPLFLTGNVNSLIITHNSWFLGLIVPQLFDYKYQLSSVNLSGSLIFENMNYRLWMDNGRDFPSSYPTRKLHSS